MDKSANEDEVGAVFILFSFCVLRAKMVNITTRTGLYVTFTKKLPATGVMFTSLVI